MRPYPVVCQAAGCDNPATHKIAARWSDGFTTELKTYSLTCAGCLAAELAAATAKQQACRLTIGETLDRPAVYERVAGPAGVGLVRRPDVEGAV